MKKKKKKPKKTQMLVHWFTTTNSGHARWVERLSWPGQLITPWSKDCLVNVDLKQN
jgi:hypothetical protein